MGDRNDSKNHGSDSCCCSSSNNNNNNIVVPPIIINGTPSSSSTTSNIQFAFAETQSDIINFPENTETPILSIPAFSTTGQIVKLEAMTNVFIQEPTDSSEFTLEIIFSLFRDGNRLVFTEDVIRNIRGPRQLTLNLTWVDVPPPGIHTYEIRLRIRSTPNGSLRQVLARSLTATLFPPGNVLPSTNL